MRDSRVFQFILMIMFGLFISCGTDSGPEIFMVTANPSPIEAGEVSPASAEVEEEQSHTVQASANEGWEFTGWTGSLSSEDNPFTFLVNQDVNLTANFADIRSEYTVELRLSDGTDQIELIAGQRSNSSSSNELVPPSPPDGTLHAHIHKDGEDWWSNFQTILKKEIEWEFHFQKGETVSVTLHWNLDIEKMEGDLTLHQSNGETLVHMDTEDEIDLSGDVNSPLLIRYQLDVE